ncbi:tripartite tricarboxylate transporter TctB family protein [Elioraea rosea]|uniref:tripartite tricarboxylate transporter TctB family protein n=1 Tax=Elioraea rosea TaxID=2492390 RepID=UPI001186D304|nr:tripartite tricarboxylate transporter TctB family protein [Elioraea rosea]
MARRFTGIGLRTAEVGLALLFAAVAALAIADALDIGAGWSEDGPRSGYFPFWIGLILLAASLWQLVGALGIPRRLGFATREELGRVASVLVPAALQVAAMPFVGLYVSSALLITWFMTRLGSFAIPVAAATGVAVAIVAFVVFEIWFLVALPKGPIEQWLGY